MPKLSRHICFVLFAVLTAIPIFAETKEAPKPAESAAPATATVTAASHTNLTALLGILVM